MKLTRLADVAFINPKGLKLEPDRDVSFVGMAQLDATTAEAIPLETRPFSAVSKGYTVFADGDILAAKITPCWENGKVGQAKLDHAVGVGSTEFHVVRPSADLDRRYLLHFLRQPSIRHDGERRMTGSAGQKRVPIAFFQDLEVPVPSITEQRRVAAILDQADSLRTRRRQVLAHLDTLTQSIFHSMFGDGSGLPQRRFGDVVSDLEGGRSIVADDPKEASGARVLKISAVTSDRFRAGESKPLPADYIPASKHFVHRGDLLMSRANTADLVGAVAMIEDDVEGLVLPDKIWRFVWHDEAELDPVYIWKLMATPGMRHALSGRATGTGGSMKNISKEKLKAMPIPFPSVREQRLFRQRMSRIARSRTAAEAALVVAESLFLSLQSRAFRGEL